MPPSPDPTLRPRLSVIVNNYNHERFLPAAINSVLMLKMPLAEVIVVDDGSTDGSREVIAAYGARITPIFQDNAGQLRACLNALARSTGDYVYFLDADDVVSAVFAEIVPPLLDRNPAKIQFRLSSIDSDGAPLNSTFPSFPKRYGQAEIVRDMAAWGFYVTPPTSGNVFRRDVLERVASLRIDYETAVDGIALYLAPLVGEVATVDRPLAFYRLHGSNLHQQHVLSAVRLRKEIERTRARSTHFAEITGGGGGVPLPASPAMVREWMMMADVAEGRRPRPADALVFLSGLWRASFRLKNKLMLSAWAAAALVLPQPLRRTASLWRLSPLNRPGWLNRRLARS